MPLMTAPKTKPTMPSMRLLVRACAILPESIAFTVDHATNARMAAGMRKMRNSAKAMLNGKSVALVGTGVMAEETEIDVAKINPKNRRPRIPTTATIT